MSTFSGDFLGFQLGDIHSSNLNLTRVSSGGWYSENLSPNFTDLVANIPGVDGTYYWGTNHTQKAITIDFAFDDMDDTNLKKLRQVLGFKGLKKLIFDEFPYKQYMVKCSAPPNIKYICFDKDEYRIYKGEGSVNLVAYSPYATATQVANIAYNKNGCLLSNSGDIECSFKLIYTAADLKNGLNLTLYQNSKQIGKLVIGPITVKDGDEYILIDGYTHLVEGLDSNLDKTGNLYNGNITSGNFFKIQVGINRLNTNKEFYSGSFTPLYF